MKAKRQTPVYGNIQDLSCCDEQTQPCLKKKGGGWKMSTGWHQTTQPQWKRYHYLPGQVRGSTTLPIGTVYQICLWWDVGPLQRNKARPLSRDFCTISATALTTASILIWAWQQHLSHQSWLSGWPFTIFSPHQRMIITKGTAPRVLQKVVLENTSHILSCPVNHSNISRGLADSTFFCSQKSLPRTPPESPHCSVLSHLKAWVTWTRATTIMTQLYALPML